MAENRPKIEIAKKREKTAYFLADSRFFCHGTIRKLSIWDTACP
nr:MAG TPA: agelenin not protein [Caudoviricetes sp.]DAY44512.1 MAG TPA: agelenin not protein [Caudoviricetes sp.]